MEFFLSFVKTMSVLSVVLAGVWLLIPSGGMTRSFRFAIGLFSLSVIVSFFISTPFDIGDIDTDKSNATAYTETANKMEILSIEYAIENILTDSGIECEKIELITDISENGSINITKAVAELKDDNDFEKAAAIVMKETGIELGGG